MSKYYKETLITLKDFMETLKDRREGMKIGYPKDALSILLNEDKKVFNRYELVSNVLGIYISLPTKDDFEYFNNERIDTLSIEEAKDFIIGIYIIVKKFPMLNSYAINKLISMYDKDFFEQNEIIKRVETIIYISSGDDDMMERLFNDFEIKYKEFQNQKVNVKK